MYQITEQLELELDAYEASVKVALQSPRPFVALLDWYDAEWRKACSRFMSGEIDATYFRHLTNRQNSILKRYADTM